MGTCLNKQNPDENDLFGCCNSNPEFKSSEIVCGLDQIKYYLNNKITDLTIDFRRGILTDTSNKSVTKEIKFPENYFKFLDYFGKFHINIYQINFYS